MPFQRPILTDLVNRSIGAIETRIRGAKARPPRSVLNALAYTHAAGLDGLYGYLDWISRQALPDTSEDPVLIRQALIWGVPREPATAAAGNVPVTGNPHAVAPRDQVLTRADGIQYALTADCVLDGSGTGTGSIAATTPGIVTNCAAGTVLTFATPIAGIASTATIGSGGLGGGADLETIDSLRGRLLERIQQPPMGGAGNDYIRWAKSVPGVTRVWVYPGWAGAGTVGIAFVMDGRSSIIPLSDDIAAVQAAIDAVRPVTARVIVFAPTPAPLDLSLHLVPDTLANRAAVAAQVASLVAREAAPGGTLKLTHLTQAIGFAMAAGDYVLAAPAADVVSAPGVLTVPGSVSWS